jgi:hypothetical protein
MLAEVMDVTAKEALVHYVCLSRHYDEWIDVSEDHSRIACVTNTAPCVMHTSLNILHTLHHFSPVSYIMHMSLDVLYPASLCLPCHV